MKESDAVLSVDVGGTAIAAGVVTVEGEVCLAREVATPGGDRAAVVETVLELAAGVKAEAAARRVRLLGCGIGVPGAVDVETGRIGPDVQNVPTLAGCPLGDLVATRTGLATVVDNDVNALGLGEARFGVARGCRSFVLLAIGTGVGAAIYANGDLVRGASGYGGELGHVTVRVDGRSCVCGGRGCLKAYVAGPDIVAQAQEGVPGHPESWLAARAREGALSPRDVFEAAEGGDALGRRIVHRVCRVLGAALGGIMNGLNPEVIVLTGGVAGSLPPHLEIVLRWARAHSFETVYRAARVVVVPIGKGATVRGGAALFLDRSERPAPRPRIRREPA